MKKRFLIALALGWALSMAPSQANVTITGGYAQIYQADGVSGIGAGKIGILVADLGSTAGIIDPYNTVLTAGSFLGGSSDDQIIAVLTSTTNVSGFGAGVSGFDMSISFDYTGVPGTLAAGNNLYLLWFPTISLSGSTIGSGVSYGQYRSSTPNTASGGVDAIGFIAPADGTVADMSAFVSSLAPGSSVTVADFTANKITAVPEPSAYGLMGIGAIVLVVARMRCRRSQA